MASSTSPLPTLPTDLQLSKENSNPAKNGNSKTSSVVSMVYNEYGELVEPESLRRPPIASELTTTGILRVFKKAYHHYVSTPINNVPCEHSDPSPRENSVSYSLISLLFYS